MPVRAYLPGYRRLNVFRDAATRTGVYCGACLSFVVLFWLLVSNFLPALERFAIARDVIAATLIGFLALVPVIRFFRLPGSLVTSSLLSWLILALFYRVCCMFFQGLGDWMGAFQIFMYGVIVYMIVATLCWIGTIVWRARSHHVSHSNHHVS
jgi:uncharacterized membrane protein YvlD (DUF360 family)